jgi:hypothetical protein
LTPSGHPTISNPEFLDLLLRVQVLVDGRKKFAHVTFYKGYLFSIELKQPGRSYAGKELVTLNVGRGNPKQTYTRAIDCLEHGGKSERDSGN